MPDVRLLQASATGMPKPKPLSGTAAHFWFYVNKDGPIPVNLSALGQCWEWTGHRFSNGYGHCHVNQQGRLAHRVAYELAVGPIPNNLQVDHLCRNTACVNPEHLEIVTPRVNALRSNSPASQNARKTHCPQGHPYDLLNTYIAPNRDRVCRICSNAASRRYQRRERERKMLSKPLEVKHGD